MVLGDVLWWAGAGVIAGIAGAAAAAHSLRALLYRVSPAEPAAFLASAGVLIACATLAAVPPCLRAICIDPACTLRQE